MPGPGTSFIGGPVLTGTVPNPGYQSGQLADMGLCVLTQSTTLVQNGAANVVTNTLALPIDSQIIDIIVDTTTVWNSSSSDTLSVGTAAAGTQYAGSVDVKTSAVRIRPTFTAAQLSAMSNIGTNVNVYITVTPSGGTLSTGTTIVTLIYAQTVQTTLGPG